MTITFTFNELPKIARQIIALAHSKILLFCGEMGVGKTTLIKEIVKQLGVAETTGSPTFSIVNEYQTAEDIIYHFDFYRIENIDEAHNIGVEDYFYSGHYVFIEWPEKIMELLPGNTVKINIIKNINGSRTLTMIPVK